MALRKAKLGELIEQTNQINSDLTYGKDDVMGMTIEKTIIKTKANISDTDLSKFLIVKPNQFIYNPRTHGKHIGLGFNNTGKNFLISWNNVAFKIKEDKEAEINPIYLFMIFNRGEWDRMACFDSWGSSTEVFSWDSLCDMEIELPDLPTQEKYVNIYLSMLENQKAYENGLEDLKLVCDGYIENLKNTTNCENIGKYIELRRIKNSNEEIKDVYGVSTIREFITASSAVDTDNLSSYKVVEYQDIAYVPTTHMKVYAIAISRKKEPFVISPIYEVFRVKDKNILNPEFLFLWLCRDETIRYSFYNSWGSARENFIFDDMCTVRMPIPNKEIQDSIVNIFKCYVERKQINEKLKSQIRDICPILIKGSVEEAMEN